ncbi:MAG: hypothetical protein HN392_07710 [Anaerolineae bacterium]|jgi:hypothetical protein|nr:hypothetical protein [Anaerolineae bacterium]MBT7073583.1 hypothetical protein [Anaerolineae bacterium]MBT7781627.1 hypothetical protein [Anaerolineae bacterium]
MKEDRFLTVILLVIAFLIIASLSIFFLRQDNAVYLSEDLPEHIIHNYFLAIEKGEYERAYTYLSEGENKPSYSEFETFFLFDRRHRGYKIGKTNITTNSAYVEITITENSSGFFFDRYDYVENAHLLKEEGEWKIIEMPYTYWDWAWYEE